MTELSAAVDPSVLDVEDEEDVKVEELVSELPAEVPASGPSNGSDMQRTNTNKSDSSGMQRTNTNRSQPGRRIRMSVNSRTIAALQREGQHLSSWVVGLLYLETNPGMDKIQSIIGERLLDLPRFRSQMVTSGLPGFKRTHFRELDEADLDFTYHFKTELEGHAVGPEERDAFIGAMFHGYVVFLVAALRLGKTL